MKEVQEKENMRLSELKKSDCGVVIGFTALGEVRKRLIDMGLVRGSQFKVIRKAPLGDPIEIKLNGFLLSLRLEEASHILVNLDA